MNQIDLTVTDDPALGKNDHNWINKNGKRSWVWTHFNATTCGKKLQCMVMSKSGKECGALLTCDIQSSTKGMSNHLTSKHNLGDPSKKSKRMGMIERYTSIGKNPKWYVLFLLCSIDNDVSKASQATRVSLTSLSISEAPLEYNVSKDWNSLLHL